MTPEELQKLVEHLQSLKQETEWVEFKHNNSTPPRLEGASMPLPTARLFIAIRDTVDGGMIRLAGGSRKDASYVPFWA